MSGQPSRTQYILPQPFSISPLLAAHILDLVVEASPQRQLGTRVPRRPCPYIIVEEGLHHRFQWHRKLHGSRLEHRALLRLPVYNYKHWALMASTTINMSTSASRLDHATLSDLTATTYRTTSSSFKRSKQSTTLPADGSGSGSPHGTTTTASSFDSKIRALVSAPGWKSPFPNLQ